MSVKLKQIVATVKESILLKFRHFVDLGEKLKDITELRSIQEDISYVLFSLKAEILKHRSGNR